jgi:hypothetical protein
MYDGRKREMDGIRSDGKGIRVVRHAIRDKECTRKPVDPDKIDLEKWERPTDSKDIITWRAWDKYN